MRSIITPEDTPSWVYDELFKLINLDEWQKIDKQYDMYVDLDYEHKCATLTVPVVVAARNFSSMLKILDRYRLDRLDKHMRSGDKEAN